MTNNTSGSAHFSPCRTYRYSLTRRWNDGLTAMFIGLNPSTADETNDDPTVRRCIGYAKAWGYGGLVMTNLFAYRATKPADMMAAEDPIGPENDAQLRGAADAAGIVVAAWGAKGSHRLRGAAVRAMLPRLHYLRLTQAGQPQHPLHLPKGLRPLELP